MGNVWKPKAGDVATSNGPSYIHGLLLPATVKYFSVTFKQGEKPVEVEEAEYYKLPANQRKQEVTLVVDPKAIREEFTYDPYNLRVELGSRDWKAIVLPSINDVTGLKDPDSVIEFAKRAAESTWYVEYERVVTGSYVKKGETKTTILSQPKFIRMTQSKAEAIGWNQEHYPNTTVETVVPLELEESAKLAYVRLCKKDMGRFQKFIQDTEEFQPYEAKLLKLAEGW